MFRYFEASNPCILVLTTSRGVLPKTEEAPKKNFFFNKVYLVLNHWCTSCHSHEAHERSGDVLLMIVASVIVLERFHDEEPDGLVGALLHYGGGDAFVNSSDSFNKKVRHEWCIVYSFWTNKQM